MNTDAEVLKHQEEKKLLSKIIIIGAPGAGKSTITAQIASRYMIPEIDTDKEFRKCRADAHHPVTEAFVKAMANKGLAIDTSKLANGQTFRDTYGEEVFRDYEKIMLRYYAENGLFEGKMISTSSTAPMYQENRTLFAKMGIKFVLLDTPEQDAVQNLYNDWRNGNPRGAYDMAANKAVVEGKDPKEALKAKYLQTKKERYPVFKLIAWKTIRPIHTSTIGETTHYVLTAIIRQNKNKLAKAKALEESQSPSRNR